MSLTQSFGPGELEARIRASYVSDLNAPTANKTPLDFAREHVEKVRELAQTVGGLAATYVLFYELHAEQHRAFTQILGIPEEPTDQTEFPINLENIPPCSVLMRDFQADPESGVPHGVQYFVGFNQREAEV